MGHKSPEKQKMSNSSLNIFTRAHNLPQEVQNLPFFHADISGSDEASDVLRRFSRGAGSFLMRPSTKGDNLFTISMMIHNGNIRHVNVSMQMMDSRVTYYIIPEVRFTSAQELCQYYQQHRICNMEKIDNVRLLHPIERSPHQTSFDNHAASFPDAPRQRFQSHQENSDIGFPLPAVGTFKSPRLRTQSEGLPQPGDQMVPAVSCYPSRAQLMMRSRMMKKQASTGHLGSPLLGQKGFMGSSQSTLAWQKESFPQDRCPSEDGSDAGSSVRFELDSEGSEHRSSFHSEDSATASSHSAAVPVDSVLSNPAAQAAHGKKVKSKQDSSYRPPMPLPLNAAPQGAENPYYTEPRDISQNRLEELQQSLRDSERCDCGLRLVDADLAQGWTVHVSRDTPFGSRPFYQDREGGTSWNIPEDIVPLLTEAQQDFVKKLYAKCSLPPPEVLMAIRNGKPLKDMGHVNDAMMF